MKNRKFLCIIAIILCFCILVPCVFSGCSLNDLFNPPTQEQPGDEGSAGGEEGGNSGGEEGGNSGGEEGGSGSGSGDGGASGSGSGDGGASGENLAEIEFHFLTLGNKYSGDCIYVNVGDIDILIDAGSKASSVETIEGYLDAHVTDGIIEYAIATHAHEDHIAGFAKAEGNIFELFEFKTIIDFPRTNSTTKTYQRYVNNRDAEVALGAKHFTALECYNNSKEGALRTYELAEGVSMSILYNYYYEHNTSNENNYSVCLLFEHGDRDFLFTGDLEDNGEEKLVEYNNLGQVEVFKAGHHGSYTASTDALLSVIKPKVCVVTCVAGTDEYSDELKNQFPAQDVIDRISTYTNNIYVTSIGDSRYTNGKDFADFNGNVVITSSSEGVGVVCSASSTLLKDSEWYKHRYDNVA